MLTFIIRSSILARLASHRLEGATRQGGNVKGDNRGKGEGIMNGAGPGIRTTGLGQPLREGARLGGTILRQVAGDNFLSDLLQSSQGPCSPRPEASQHAAHTQPT